MSPGKAKERQRDGKKMKNKPRNMGLKSLAGTFPSASLRASPGSHPVMLQNPPCAPLSRTAYCKYQNPNAQKGMFRKELEQNPSSLSQIPGKSWSCSIPFRMDPSSSLKAFGLGELWRAGNRGDGGGGRKVSTAVPSSGVLPNPPPQGASHCGKCF